MGRILIADDDEKFYQLLKQQLDKCQYSSTHVAEPDEVLAGIRTFVPDLVFLDINFGDGKEKAGLDILRNIRAVPEYQNLPVIMIASRSSYKTIVQSLDDGAVDIFSKPLIFSELSAKIKVLLDKREKSAPGQSEWHEEIVFVSPIMNKLVKELYRSAKAGMDTLILGENGVGKDLMARRYHELSPRSGKPFIPVHCPALDGQLFTAELFGHCKGAFTGATAYKKGKIEAARDGIVFLNEIGELSLDNQTKLLNFFEEGKTITPVGSEKSESVDVIILAATNRNLDEMMHKGLFRKDFNHRFRNVIKVPPLREHLEDIPLLVEHFVRKYNFKYQKQAVIDPELVAHLQTMSWSGNVRQLEICVENCVVGCFGNCITLADIKKALAPKNSQDAPAQEGATDINLDLAFSAFKAGLKEMTGRHYAEYIVHQLELHRYNVAQTAEAMGICRKRLDQLMKQLKIRKG